MGDYDSKREIVIYHAYRMHCRYCRHDNFHDGSGEHNGISGNIIFNVGLKIPSIGSFSRIFFMMTMIGVASYMYLKED